MFIEVFNIGTASFRSIKLVGNFARSKMVTIEPTKSKTITNLLSKVSCWLIKFYL